MNLDFKQQADWDLDFSSNDIEMVDGTRQHQRDLIICRAGSLKDTPTIGVGVEDYFNDESAEDMLRKVRQQVEKDGQTVKQIEVIDGQIELTAGYAEN